MVESACMDYLTALAALIFLLWLWHSSLKARETATQLARQECTDRDLQFLDGTVAFSGVWLQRNDGRIRLWRGYRFEFADHDGRRFAGRLVLSGLDLEELHLYVGRPAH